MKQNKIPRNEYIRKPVGKTNPYKDNVIYSNLGQGKYPGQVTRIPSGDITMQGVPYPVYGEDNLGYSQMMYPGMDYQFPGQYVTEIPMAQDGVEFSDYISNYRRPGPVATGDPRDSFGYVIREAAAKKSLPVKKAQKTFLQPAPSTKNTSRELINKNIFLPFDIERFQAEKWLDNNIAKQDNTRVASKKYPTVEELKQQGENKNKKDLYYNLQLRKRLNDLQDEAYNLMKSRISPFKLIAIRDEANDILQYLQQNAPELAQPEMLTAKAAGKAMLTAGKYIVPEIKPVIEPLEAGINFVETVIDPSQQNITGSLFDYESINSRNSPLAKKVFNKLGDVHSAYEVKNIIDQSNQSRKNIDKKLKESNIKKEGGWLDKYDGGGDPETPPKNPPSSANVEAEYLNMLARKRMLPQLLEQEQARVSKVRGNIIPVAQRIDAADDKILKQQGPAYQHFQKMLNAKNPEELQQFIKTMPSDLKSVLPGKGTYNIARWDKKNNNWDYQSSPSRELYCTPYGCFNYQEAGAKDVPMIGGNYGFVGGVEKGTLPFQEIPASQAQPGDMTIIYGMAPSDYRDPDAKLVDRPHHTTIAAEAPILDEKGKAKKVKVYNAVEGNRLFYDISDRSAGGDDQEHYKFYRYVGNIPKYEKELADIQEYFKNTRLPDMQPIQSRLPQAPEPELKREGGWLDKYDNKYKRGGGKSKSKFTSKNIQSSINTLFARNYDLFGPSGKKYYNPLSKFDDGGQPVFDPATGMYTLPEVTIEAEAPEWSDLSEEYERTNPLQAFVRGRKEDVIRQSPRGLNKLFGVNPSQFASSIENNIANEYDYLKNTAIIEGIAKSRGIDLSERGDWVDQLSNKEKEILANSKYETLLQPSFYAKSLAGLQELAGYMPGTLPNKYAPVTPGLTKREQEEIHNEKFLGVPTGALNAFQFMDVPGQAIANVLKNRGLSTGSDYRDIPGVLSGKSMGNVNPLDAALMNPFNTVGAPEAVVGLGRGTVALGKGVYQLGKKGYEEAPRIGKFLKQGFNKFENLVGQGFDNLSRQENAMYLDDLYRRGIIDNPNPTHNLEDYSFVDPWEDYTPPYGNEPSSWDAAPYDDWNRAANQADIDQYERELRASNVEPSSNQLPPPPSEIILPQANRFRETYNSILGNLRNQFRRSGETLSADDIASRFARENGVNDLYSSSPASSRNNELPDPTVNSLLGYNQPATQVVDPIVLRREIIEAIPNKKVKDITDKVLQTNKRSTGTISYYDVLQNDRGGVNPEIRDFDQHFIPTNQLDSRIEDLQTSLNELKKSMEDFGDPKGEQRRFIIDKLQQELEDAKSTKWLRTERVEELKAQGLDPDDQLSIVTTGGSYFAPKQLVDKNGKILGTINLSGTNSSTITSTGLAYNQHGYAFGKQFANGARNYTKEEARDVLARRAYDELLMTHPSAASDPDRLKGFEQAAYEIADGKIKEIEYNNNNSFGLTLYRGVHHGIKDTRGNLRSFKHFADTALPNKITGFLETEKRAKRAWNSWDRQGYVKNNPIAGEDPIETGYYEFIKKFGGSFDAVRYLKEHSRKMNKGGSTQGWLDNY